MSNKCFLRDFQTALVNVIALHSGVLVARPPDEAAIAQTSGCRRPKASTTAIAAASGLSGHLRKMGGNDQNIIVRRDGVGYIHHFPMISLPPKKMYPT